MQNLYRYHCIKLLINVHLDRLSVLMKEHQRFDKIDFEEIEYRNEYRYTKQALAALAGFVFPLAQILYLTIKLGGVSHWLQFALMMALYVAFAVALFIKFKSHLQI